MVGRDQVEREPSGGNEKSSWWRRKDWFGYALGGIMGLIITVAATWYQMTTSQKEATAAEFERARSIRQSVIAIVEEDVLSGSRRLDPDLINRLVDQRRRDQFVTLSIPVRDVVEQAEFNVLSSRYLSTDRKEQIKPVFVRFFTELASRSYVALPDTTPVAQQWNILAKQIQDGKSVEALATLRQLQEEQATALEVLREYTRRPSFTDSLFEFFRKPTNALAFFGLYMVFTGLLIAWRRSHRYRISGLRKPPRF
ncbi:hypothetical protein [Ottowia thiooxydans]|uniref:Transmembrane protein n=1 Tax=Ottowia thiooxydans TaxID=219182 RepID=A0ABV2Q8Q7_9BURK